MVPYSPQNPCLPFVCDREPSLKFHSDPFTSTKVIVRKRNLPSITKNLIGLKGHMQNPSEVRIYVIYGTLLDLELSITKLELVVLIRLDQHSGVLNAYMSFQYFNL